MKKDWNDWDVEELGGVPGTIVVVGWVLAIFCFGVAAWGIAGCYKLIAGGV